jgi:hypothetical protein
MTDKPSMDNPISEYSACIHLFTHLQALEPRLKCGCRVKITRSTDKAIFFSVHAIGGSKPLYSVRIRAGEHSSMDNITATIAHVIEDLKNNKLFTTNN